MGRLNDDMLIEDTELSDRAKLALTENQALTVRDARNLTDWQILHIPNVGKVTLAEIRDKLGDRSTRTEHNELREMECPECHARLFVHIRTVLIGSKE
jgi:DNA-directed RNA polymerase alpha subunit